jgi:hypothetical protein
LGCRRYGQETVCGEDQALVPPGPFTRSWTSPPLTFASGWLVDDEVDQPVGPLGNSHWYCVALVELDPKNDTLVALHL